MSAVTTVAMVAVTAVRTAGTGSAFVVADPRLSFADGA